MNTNSSNKGSKHLQYAFLLDQNDNIFPCDDASGNFLASINLDDFIAHCQYLHINQLNVASTIVLNGCSYCMHIASIEPFVEYIPKKYAILASFNIVVLQSQPLLSEIIQLVNAESGFSFFKEELNSYANGLFFTRRDSTVLSVNDAWRQITGVYTKEMEGKSIYDLNSEGVFTPILLPAILNSQQDYFALQYYSTDKLAIISGKPIYDSLGNIAMIIICISSLTVLQSLQISEPAVSGKMQRQPSHDADHVEDSHQIDLIVESLEMRKLMQDAMKAAHFDVPILLLGESGTGKEVFSEVIHFTSKRREGPFIKVNCSAIPSSLLDSELFGYEPNAFTGASAKGHSGLFEAANHGTILLDEIGDMPLEAQAKILRVIQTGELFRVGSPKPRKVNVRIIAATNKDLLQMISDGTFRMDLYFRLSVIAFYLPPLRERREDIVPLLLHYCYYFNKRYHMKKTISNELQETLKTYDWPGNIRELRNIIERMMIICVNDNLQPDDFYSVCKEYARLIRSGQEKESSEPVIVNGLPQLKDAVRYVEAILVERALEIGGSTREAAELLGVSQATIMRKMKEHDLKK